MNAEEVERQMKPARDEWQERYDLRRAELARRRAEQWRDQMRREGHGNKGKRPLTLEEIHELQRRQSDIMAAYVVAVIVLLVAIYIISAVIGVVS